MKNPTSLEELIEALRCLPGVGPKSSQRMAYHLLQRDHAGAARLAAALGRALELIRHCERCNTFSEEQVCVLCRSMRRDASLLCVVETPADFRKWVAALPEKVPAPLAESITQDTETDPVPLSAGGA